jgi:arylsulfatase A-like enzyme
MKSCLVGLTAVIAAWMLSFSLAHAAPPPNVVFILIDNCGQEWFGCYGSEEGRTPNIDRLARDGVRFEHCYTFPVCGPSRIQLLTGRYPFHHGFVMHHDAALYSGGGLDWRREVVLARPLRDAGYATGICGKWQVNNLYDQPDALKEHGFEESLVWPGSIDRDKITADDWQRFQSAIEARDSQTLSDLNRHIESRYWDPVVLRNGQRERLTGKFGPDVFQEFALDFMTRHRDGPFFLYYPMTLTHGQSFIEHVVPTPINCATGRPEHEMYGEMVEYADCLVQGVIDKLDELGLRENTIVFVASDNGSESALTARMNGRTVHGGLYQLTEAGGDVALVANGPKRIPGGRTIALADFTDIYPTVCELAGVPLPAGVTIDGRSHAGVLRGSPDAKPAREWMFNQYAARRVVRDGRFKLYSTGELFDVAADREEKNDLAANSDADVVAARSRLEQVLASLPADAPPPIPLRSLSAFKLWPTAAEAPKSK